MTAAAGCVALASFEGVSINNAPLTGFIAVKGYDQATSLSSGIVAVNEGAWGPTWQTGIRPLSSAGVGINGVSLDYIVWDMPTGTQSAFLHQLCWNDSSSTDVYGIRPDGTEMWVNAFNSHNPFAVQDSTDTSIFSGDPQ